MVCLGGYGTHWVPSVQLDELCTMLWDMVRYHNYDIRSPYNRDAALWVANQTAILFPTDARALRDRRVAQGRLVAPGSDSKAAGTSQNGSAPSASGDGRPPSKTAEAGEPSPSTINRVRMLIQRYSRAFSDGSATDRGGSPPAPATAAATNEAPTAQPAGSQDALGSLDEPSSRGETAAAPPTLDSGPPPAPDSGPAHLLASAQPPRREEDSDEGVFHPGKRAGRSCRSAGSADASGWFRRRNRLHRMSVTVRIAAGARGSQRWTTHRNRSPVCPRRLPRRLLALRPRHQGKARGARCSSHIHDLSAGCRSRNAPPPFGSTTTTATAGSG